MGILDHAKELAELIKKYNDQDLYQRIVDLRDEIFALREKNLNLKEELRVIKADRDVEAQLTKERNVYFRVDPNGTRSGPYCMMCWDSDRKLVNLTQEDGGYTWCLRCIKESKK
ncbi:MAG: hypothetical protein Q7J67_09635 [bacterium]|nr:hypothetical protein [bacterium]